MASLTVVAYQSRKIIKYGGFGIVGLVVVYSLVMGIIEAYLRANPPYVPPTVKYGRIDKVVFPEKKFGAKQFTLELPEDKLPTIKDQARVYIIYQPTSNILALEYGVRTAKAMGFTSKPKEAGTGIYEFDNAITKQKLTLNTLDGSFRLTYPYQEDQLLMTVGQVPDKAGAIEASKLFLEAADKWNEELETGEKKISFWKIDYDGLRAVASQSEANVTRVDLYRLAIPYYQGETDAKIVNSEVGRATISLMVSGSSVESKKMIEVDYKYHDIDRESFSTYPIISPEEAWAELQKGNYWPAFDVSAEKVAIRRVYLAYYEPIVLTNYFQPVYVFEGDGNFVAYVPAVTLKYLK